MKLESLLVAVTLLVALAVAAPVCGDDAQKAAPADAQAQQTFDLLKRLKISGYLQAQYVHDERSRDELAGSGTRNLDQFSVRRARLKFTYRATPTARFVLQPDISSSGAPLTHGYLEATRSVDRAV